MGFLLPLVVLLACVSANVLAPGYYVSTMKFINVTGVYCTRLAMISLNAGGGISSDSWTFCTDEWGGYGVGYEVGSCDQPNVPNTDVTSHVRALEWFLPDSSILIRNYGTWDIAGEAVLEFKWDSGDVEYWRQTWNDDALIKLEPYYASAVESGYQWDFYLWNNNGNFEYNSNAVNAGFAFGGSGCPPFNGSGMASILDFKEDYSGVVSRWNAYAGQPLNSVYDNEMNLGTPGIFYPSSTGIWRNVIYNENMWVFSYLCLVPGAVGGYRRAAIYQTGHDFDHIGNIYNTPGHTYAGLQILDANNEPRGFVFSDQTFDTGLDRVMIMSSMYFLSL